ncbi:MAG: GNAT family N-acetyltransferase [Ruminococcus sp.]|nr:GNAT family N-acetyltransferase [Ruminococcus sp.]
MIYLNDGHIIIRDLEERDIDGIVKAELEQGWSSDPAKFIMRLEHKKEGKAIPLAAEYEGSIAGYVSVYPACEWGAFGGKGLPEIVDLAVTEGYRRKGIGGRLLDAAEMISARYADTVYLGVGLHSGYGSAQRLYVKRGYIPDGSGVWYLDRVCGQYENCRNDDDLVLYMSKRLRS